MYPRGTPRRRESALHHPRLDEAYTRVYFQLIHDPNAQAVGYEKLLVQCCLAYKKKREDTIHASSLL